MLLVTLKTCKLLRLSDRVRFSILTTVLTFAYTFYLHLSLNFLGHYWYVITAPLATFLSSYFFGITLIKGRSFIIYILPLSAALTLISHWLNLLIFCLYLALTSFFTLHSDIPDYDYNGVIGFIFFMIYGPIISLYNGGLVSFIIFLLSGTLGLLIPSKFKKDNLSEVTLPTDDRNN